MGTVMAGGMETPGTSTTGIIKSPRFKSEL
jgi:hypothetical protein